MLNSSVIVFELGEWLRRICRLKIILFLDLVAIRYSGV